MQTQYGGKERDKEGRGRRGGRGERRSGRGVHGIAAAAAAVIATSSPRHESLKKIPADEMQYLALRLPHRSIIVFVPSKKCVPQAGDDGGNGSDIGEAGLHDLA